MQELTLKITPLIYGLVDPRTAEIRYVGLSRHGLRRAKQHLKPTSLRKDFLQHNRHKAAWIYEVLNAGLRPYIMVIARCETPEDLPAAERFWIEKLRQAGEPLTNKTVGGDGVRGFKFTAEQRCVISRRTREGMAIMPAESRARMHAPRAGSPRAPFSHETRRRMSAAAKKRSPSFAGKTHSESARTTMSEKACAWHTQNDHPMLGKHQSDETKRHLSEVHGTAIIDQDGTRYHSINQASKALGISRPSLTKALVEQRSTKCGRRFEYARTRLTD